LEPAAGHVCSELIDLIEAAVRDSATKSLIPQVTHHEIMSSVSKIHEISRFRFSRWTRWQTMNPPARTSGPAYNAHFTTSALLLAILTTNIPILQRFCA
jgi:hypothetical protein